MGLLQQFRCPSGLMGRLAGAAMVVTNTPLVRAVTAAVGAADGEHVLDIGFGPGVQAAGFAGIDARYQPTRGGQALVCTALDHCHPMTGV
jgi:ubiquinone/menaquinone biosynthesis C-methylase UbiE